MKRFIIIDMRRITDKENAQNYLARKLRAPEYYGKNLDALYDVLTEISASVVLYHTRSRAEDSYAAKVIRVFSDAAEENARLTVKIR